MSTVQECLDQKPKRIISIASGESVFNALELMKTNRVRAILVVDEDLLVGIVSQGDCAIRAYLKGLDIVKTPVGLTDPIVGVQEKKFVPDGTKTAVPPAQITVSEQ